jgi:hypothetical protein
MHASTHALGLHAPAGLGTARLRDANGAAGTMTSFVGVGPGTAAQWMEDELPRPRSHRDWTEATRASRVEDVLFAITFAALAALWPGAYLLQVL